MADINSYTLDDGHNVKQRKISDDVRLLEKEGERLTDACGETASFKKGSPKQR